MVQEFTKNIQRLFTEIVVDKCQKCVHNADELLAVLQRKVTLPISVIKDGGHIRLVYDNVTIELRHDLASLQIVYNSDYQMTLGGLSSCDIHQLSEFVLSLERDIPKWQHIWMAESKVCKMRLHMQDRVKSIMSEMRTVWKENPYPIKDNLIQQYRLRYYNLKACQLMLNIGNPYWENKTTEQEILEECRLYHINAPIESWCEEYDELLNQCSKLRDERERRMEEWKRQQEKEHHLAQLKKLKLQAFIKTMEFHPEFCVTVCNISEYRRPVAPILFGVDFTINKDVVPYRAYYTDFDRLFPKITDAIKRINDLMPDLNNTLKDNTTFYYATDNRFAVQICKIIDELNNSV